MKATGTFAGLGGILRGGGATGAAILVAALCSSVALAEDPVSEVTYSCADDKTIEATYYADRVDVILSDGRSMSLPQTMSGSGIRYANADESFVFWSKGKTAFATEGNPNEPTFSDCVEQEPGSAAAADIEELGWESYVNSRFGFSVDVPGALLQPLPPSPNGDGVAFENTDRGIHVAVFGAMNALELTFDQYYQSALADPELGRVIYERKTDGWFVLSGFRTVDRPAGPQEMIFYNRIAIDEPGTAISGLTLLFPPALKETMDPIVTRMSQSLTSPSLPDG